MSIESSPRLLSSPYAPFVLTAIELLGLYYYPGSDRWTPARCCSYKQLQTYRIPMGMNTTYVRVIKPFHAKLGASLVLF